MPNDSISPPPTWHAFEFRGRMRGGRSKPIHVRCHDGGDREFDVVLKLRVPEETSSNFGPASLACELICAMLARMAGLSVPDYGIVSVSDNDGFIGSIPDSEIRHLFSRNSGLNFGSTYIEGNATYTPYLFPDIETSRRLEAILAFDAYVLNNDRQKSNTNIITKGGVYYLIDHSLGFPHLSIPSLSEPWNYLLPDENVQNHCAYEPLRGKRREFADFASFLSHDLSRDDCVAILAQVPDEWQRRGSSDKDSILDYLVRRAQPFISAGIGNLSRVCMS